MLLLPLLDASYSFSLEGHEGRVRINGHCVLNAQHTPSDAYENAVLVAVGSNPYTLIHNTFNVAKGYLRELNEYFLKSCYKLTHPPDHYPRGSGPSFADYIGWCTWDAFYTGVNAVKVLRGLDSFAAVAVKPGFLVLDDGWQSTDVDVENDGEQWAGMLTSFDAKPNFMKDSNIENFPAFVSHVKEKFGVKSLLVWHTFTGYWRGVDVDGEALERFNSKLTYPRISQSELRMSSKIKVYLERSKVASFGLVPPENVAAFFGGYHAQLKAAGVDGVKVDAQAILPSLLSDSLGGGIHLTSSYHLALQQSVIDSFGGSRSTVARELEEFVGQGNVPVELPVIHCMCHSQATLFSIAAMYPDLLNNKASHRYRPIVRGSDDYYPRLVASHGPHLFSNAINSLFISEVGLHDWDMFGTNMAHVSSMHAASRAISGGPVYTSDIPGSQNASIYSKLAFPSGRVPRCIRNARPVLRMLFEDPQREVGVPLMIQNANPDGFVIGAFSIAGAVVENDSSGYRLLKPEELIWPHQVSFPIESGLPVWDLPDLKSAMQIDAVVFLSDIEEMLQTQDRTDSYLAYRSNDNTIHGVFAVQKTLLSSQALKVHLPSVFDFAIVSFAKIHYASPENWIAAIGASSMYNPGGAVLHAEEDRLHNQVSFDVIGSGDFLFVLNATPSRVTETAITEEAHPISEAITISPRYHKERVYDPESDLVSWDAVIALVSVPLLATELKRYTFSFNA